MKVLQITHKRDEDGTPIVLVPLENIDKSAILFQEDYDLLISFGVDPFWTLNANLVLARGKLPIARLIVDAGKLQKVHYKDSDPLNLKRDNLVIVIGGSARSSTREKLFNKPFRVRRTVKVEHITIKPSWETTS